MRWFPNHRSTLPPEAFNPTPVRKYGKTVMMHCQERAPIGVQGRPLCDRGAGHDGIHMTLKGAWWHDTREEPNHA